mgnify:CR=1 FL=1
MANNIKQQPGDVIDWTNGTGSDVASGGVVVIGANGDAVIGVALTAIADTKTGSVRIAGAVATVPKVSAAVITAGEYVMWDSSAGEFDDNQASAASGDVSDAVWAVADAAASTTTVDVLLTGKPGTLA